MSIPLTILIDRETNAYLHALARETERSRGGVVRFMIREYAATHGRPDLATGASPDSEAQRGRDPAQGLDEMGCQEKKGG